MPEEDDIRRLAADPTPLTTAMLLREIANLKEKMEVQIGALEKAQEKFEENLTRVPTEVQREIKHLNDFYEQRFRDFENQLRERSERRMVEKKAADDALSAALQAQKELAAAQDAANAAALTKAQDATDKQIDSIKAMVSAGFKTYDEKIGLVNSRLDRGEGVIGGGRDRQTEQRLNTGVMLTTMGIGVAVIVAAAAVINLILK